MKSTLKTESIFDHENSKHLGFVPTQLMDNARKVHKSKKKGVFVCYSPDAPYKEKKFVVELSKQLYEIGLHDDVWFDRDILLGGVKGPFRIGNRLEVAEKCRSAIVVLSESFFLSPQTRAEAEILLTRASRPADQSGKRKAPVLFTVKLDNWDCSLDDTLAALTENISVNLSVGKISRLSEAEKVSEFISTLNRQLEGVSSNFSVRIPKTIEDAPSQAEFKTKPLDAWSVGDVQEWLTSLKIHEKYIISFEEFEIDGFLLTTLTDKVLSDVLAVDSQICRRKILQRIKGITEEEARTGKFNEWSKQRFVRQKSNMVYLIQDPEDEQLGGMLRQDMERKGLKVLFHKSLGHSKEEFLRRNAHDIASSSHVIFLFTSKGNSSPFTFYEVLLSIWLGKPIIVAVFEDCFATARLALIATLCELPAIDFCTALYVNGLDLLLNEVKPPRAMSGIVFEQRYLKQVAEGVCQFKDIIRRVKGITDPSSISTHIVPTQTRLESSFVAMEVFISYQWDHQSKVKTIIENLSAASITCWSDMNHVTKRPITQSLPRTTPSAMSRASVQENLANEIERRIRLANVVLLCLSSSYLQSPNCLKEVSIASSYQKPIIAVLLQWLPWPPDAASYGMRRVFASVKCIDLSNEKLFVRNLPSLAPHILRISQAQG